MQLYSSLPLVQDVSIQDKIGIGIINAVCYQFTTIVKGWNNYAVGMLFSNHLYLWRWDELVCISVFRKLVGKCGKHILRSLDILKGGGGDIGFARGLADGAGWKHELHSTQNRKENWSEKWTRRLSKLWRPPPPFFPSRMTA